MKTFTPPRYAWRPAPEQQGVVESPHPVVVIGAGPVGLTAALDLAARGVRVVVLDDNDTVSVGSRALCYAKRTLEVWDRLGCGEAVAADGVRWQVGKVFFQDEMVYRFDLLPEPDHKMPAMVNLQQYHLEQTLVERCLTSDLIDMRWRHRVVSLEQNDQTVLLGVDTPEGRYTTQATWVIACDGANSEARAMVGAPFTGQAFQDRFLIADVLMKAEFPTERWFWFDPPFHPGQSALLHKQRDNVWRIDFQLGWDADPVEERKPERVEARVRQMLGPDADFELEWVSIYQFACRRIDRFRYGRVLFAGDSAHQVSPFGARGANSGVQDVDNLAWKLQCVLAGIAPETLLDSYHDERALAADDNIRNSTRSTDFITPKNASSRLYRDAVLGLSRDHAFARPLVNSGRLSLPTRYLGSSIITDDTDAFEAPSAAPGCPCPDAPVERPDGSSGWLLDHLGRGFTLLVVGADPTDSNANANAEPLPLPVTRLRLDHDLVDRRGVLSARFDTRQQAVYLIRPDQFIAARWRQPSMAEIRQALARSLAIH
ncbi:MAG: FAD-dependent oxidoreductase [Betaproteobacteria bacterium]|nr:FAD-dependent oxidoreductase [Betaproteobacteria bacterium]